MKGKKNLIYAVIGVILIGLLIAGYFYLFYSPYKFHGDGPIKIFYLNSFQSESFPLSQENIAAFKKVFENEKIDIEVKQFDMDVIRNPYGKEEAVEIAKKMIDEYKPDLLYATDDPAQEVALKYINTKTPIVFSGVNEDPEKYGYGNAKNVAGVLERVHFVEAVNFAQTIYPGIQKIGVIGADYYLWATTIEQMKMQTDELPEIDFLGWDLFYNYTDYQNKILDYQDSADALLILGLAGMKDEDEKDVLGAEYNRWTVENNKLPEITFWNFNVAEGNLLSVDVSGEEQGKAAANLAKKILIDGANPTSLEFKSTSKGTKNLNLKRAEQLGIKKENIPSSILINSETYNSFTWEDESEE